jgi:hypothetical protein
VVDNVYQKTLNLALKLHLGTEQAFASLARRNETGDLRLRFGRISRSFESRVVSRF